jgi:hypothetical protein
MSDRYSTLVVVLDNDVHEDMIEGLIDAIAHMRGVASVKANVTNLEDYSARARVKSDIREKIFEIWNGLDE